MSNKTFNISTDQIDIIVPLHHRGLQPGPSPESQYSDPSMSPSPDSSSSFSKLSDREANTSPDINMQEYCVTEGSPVDNAYNTTLPQGDVFSGVSMNLNQTFIATPVNDCLNIWNENLTPIHNQETGLEKYHMFLKNTHDGSNSLVTSPDSAGRESQLSLCETSQRGLSENSSYSLSSVDMVIRSNSFCLEDQSLSVVSSLDDSSISPAVGLPTVPVASNLLSTTLPDVCGKSPERIVEESLGDPGFGRTFIKTDNWDFLTEENDMATSNSLLTLPNENEGGLLMTFVCETSSEDNEKDTKFASEADLLHHFPGVITPEQGKTFVSTLSAMQDTAKDIHTSTPVQNIGNKVPSLPSFSESPCTGNMSCPGPNPVKQQPAASVTPKGGLVVELPHSASKDKKMETKRVLKSDSSNTKSSHLKPSQIGVNKRTEANKGATVRRSPTKVRSRPTVVSAITKIINVVQRQVNTDVAYLDMAAIQSSEHTAVDEQDNSGASPPDNHPTSKIDNDDNKHSSSIPCSKTSCEAEQIASSQVVDASAQHAGNQTFCFSSLEKSPDGQTDPKQTLKKAMSDKIEVRSGSALGQNKPPVIKTRPRFSSETSSSSSTRPPKEKRISASFTIPKAAVHQGQTKAGNLNCSSHNKRALQTEASNRTAEHATREFKKAESSKLTTEGATWRESKSKFRGGPSPKQKKENPLSQPPAASHRATLSARQRQGILGRDESRISRAFGTPQSKPKNTTVGHRTYSTGEPSLGSQPPQTPTRPSLMGPPPTSTSKIPRKTPRPSRHLAEAGVHSELGAGARSAQVSGGAAHKPTPIKSVVLKARHISTPGKNIQPTLTTTCKPTASTSKGVLYSTVSPLRRTASAKLVCLTSCRSVDKNKSKVGSCQQRHQQQASQPNQSNGPPDVVPASVAEVEKKNQRIQQLKGLLAASNSRFEAVAIVLQQTLAKSDEATRQCRELSQELVSLRGELVCSVHSSERLEKEKEELRLALEDALQKQHEQHLKDVTELEQRLNAFYQTEWDKVHLTYQEEANKSKDLMQQQMEELESKHEALKLDLQSSHTQQLQCVKQQYEMSLEELRKVHSDELQSLENTLKHAEASLSGQIQELTVENNALIEKLTAEENKRKELPENSQKDSHTVYLEQELESLKVVLDIKNKQLHQQEKKLMEMDKLTEKNVKLDESLKKVQQENEDLKARMERHAALSRQLSSEQAVLQESLQKESKVNKRLSMENEELLWKLHNGDLSSPRKVSPTSTSPLHSPSHSFSFQSPHSSSVFSSSAVSPR